MPAAGGVLVSLNYRLAPEELRVHRRGRRAVDARSRPDQRDVEPRLRAASSGRTCRPARPRPPRDLAAGHARRDLLHRRHDRDAEGRDAQPRQPARQRAAQPRRHRPPRRPALAARVPDVPRRRDRQPARVHVGRARSRCCSRASTPRAVLETIERERITHTVLVPTMLAMLLDAPGADDADLSSLRHVQYAASPISAELQRRVLERLPDCDVAQFYGMTEAAPTVTHLTPRGPPPRRPSGSPRWARRCRASRSTVAARPASCGSAARTSCSATGTARTRPPRRSSTAGTAPATSSAPTRTATSTWSTARRT